MLKEQDNTRDYRPKRKLKDKRDLTQDELSSEISINLMTTGSSRIFSHQ